MACEGQKSSFHFLHGHIPKSVRNLRLCAPYRVRMRRSPASSFVEREVTASSLRTSLDMAYI